MQSSRSTSQSFWTISLLFIIWIPSGALSEQRKQLPVDVVVASPQLLFDQKFMLNQEIKVLACSNAANLQIGHNEIDLGVGVFEQVVQQLLTVDFWQLPTDALFIGLHQMLDLHYQANRML